MRSSPSHTLPASLLIEQLVATASVFLACKVDESPRGLRDVAYVYHKTKNAKKPAELEKLRTNTVGVSPPLISRGASWGEPSGHCQCGGGSHSPSLADVHSERREGAGACSFRALGAHACRTHALSAEKHAHAGARARFALLPCSS